MFAVALTPTVNVAGTPAETGVVGAVIVIPVRGFSLTVISAVFPATFAVTFASRDVVSKTVAVPESSVTAEDADRVPLSVMNDTGMPGTGPPEVFSTRAEICDVPPAGPSVCGVAVSTTRSAAALPTRRFSIVPTAPPENAVIFARPLWPPAMNRTRTSPLCVRASLGSIRPIVVVKETSVPFCTGVPAPARVVVVGGVGVVGVPGVLGVDGGADAAPFSMTVATISISPLTGTVSPVANNVMTDPVGASSGTLSHAVTKVRPAMAAKRKVRAMKQPQRSRRVKCASMGAKDNTLMGLRGQGRERGYAMAALLVSLAVMSVIMSAVLPVWRFQARREREAELVFRGEQYARAIALFARKNAGALPPNIDVLVQGRYLRKKFKDPMTEDGEFQPLFAGANQPGQQSQPGVPQPGAPQPPGAGTRIGGTMTSMGLGVGSAGARGGGVRGGGVPGGGVTSGSFQGSPGMVTGPGGMLGVVSKSKDMSIMIYKGGTRYNEWVFRYAGLQQQPGMVPGAQPMPGMPGMPGMGPGGRGRGGRVGQPGGFGTPGPGRFGPGRSGFPPPGGRGRGQ